MLMQYSYYKFSKMRSNHKYFKPIWRKWGTGQFGSSSGYSRIGRPNVLLMDFTNIAGDNKEAVKDFIKAWKKAARNPTIKNSNFLDFASNPIWKVKFGFILPDEQYLNIYGVRAIPIKNRDNHKNNYIERFYLGNEFNPIAKDVKFSKLDLSGLSVNQACKEFKILNLYRNSIKCF